MMYISRFTNQSYSDRRPSTLSVLALKSHQSRLSTRRHACPIALRFNHDVADWVRHAQQRQTFFLFVFVQGELEVGDIRLVGIARDALRHARAVYYYCVWKEEKRVTSASERPQKEREKRERQRDKEKDMRRKKNAPAYSASTGKRKLQTGI